jgi:type II secretory pathway component GspD/PulD (secretin)
VGIDVILQSLLTEVGSLTVDERTNTLIVTDVLDNFAKIEAALAVLDIQTPQILVDAEVIETALTTVEELGVDWGSSTEGNLLTVIPAARSTRFPFNQHLLGDRGDRVGTDTTIYAAGSATSTVGLINASQAQAVLQALRSNTHSKVLARPKVLTLDNESAIIRLTTDQVVGFESNTDSTGVVSEEPIRETTGVILVVTPQVNDDDYITMLIEPSVTQVVPSQVSPASGAGGVVDPKSRSVRTLVRVRNGDTLVIGGLIDRRETEALREVPYLSRIPVLGKAFQSKSVDNTATELMTFITPYILDNSHGMMSTDYVASTALANQAIAAEVPLFSIGREQDIPSGRQRAMEDIMNALE